MLIADKLALRNVRQLRSNHRTLRLAQVAAVKVQTDSPLGFAARLLISIQA
jgi:hypothetical protein